METHPSAAAVCVKCRSCESAIIYTEMVKRCFVILVSVERQGGLPWWGRRRDRMGWRRQRSRRRRRSRWTFQHEVRGRSFPEISDGNDDAKNCHAASGGDGNDNSYNSINDDNSCTSTITTTTATVQFIAKLDVRHCWRQGQLRFKTFLTYLTVEKDGSFLASNRGKATTFFFVIYSQMASN